MTETMTKRAPNKETQLYPPWWEIKHEWEWTSRTGEKLTLVSREWEFRVASAWYTFDRFVCNHQNGKVWVDGFAQPPYGAFVSYYPAKIDDARPIQKTGNGGRRVGRPKKQTPEPDAVDGTE